MARYRRAYAVTKRPTTQRAREVARVNIPNPHKWNCGLKVAIDGKKRNTMPLSNTHPLRDRIVG